MNAGVAFLPKKLFSSLSCQRQLMISTAAHQHHSKEVYIPLAASRLQRIWALFCTGAAKMCTQSSSTATCSCLLRRNLSVNAPCYSSGTSTIVCNSASSPPYRHCFSFSSTPCISSSIVAVSGNFAESADCMRSSVSKKRAKKSIVFFSMKRRCTSISIEGARNNNAVSRRMFGSDRTSYAAGASYATGFHGTIRRRPLDLPERKGAGKPSLPRKRAAFRGPFLTTAVNCKQLLRQPRQDSCSQCFFSSDSKQTGVRGLFSRAFFHTSSNGKKSSQWCQNSAGIPYPYSTLIALSSGLSSAFRASAARNGAVFARSASAFSTAAHPAGATVPPPESTPPRKTTAPAELSTTLTAAAAESLSPSEFPHYQWERFRNHSARQLQQLAASLANRGCRDVALWSALFRRAIDINRGCCSSSTTETANTPEVLETVGIRSDAESGGAIVKAAATVTKSAAAFRSFEALSFLSSAAAVHLVDRELFLSFVPTFLRTASTLENRQLVTLLSLYEEAAAAAGGWRPRALYVMIFNSWLRLASRRVLFPHEFADLLCCLARLRIANALFLKEITSHLAAQLPLLSFSEAACCCGALHALGVAAIEFFALLEEKQHKELLLLPVEQLFTELKKTLRLEFSWQPHEDLICAEFKRRTEAMRGAADVEELADPFACLNFMRVHGLVTNEFLRALAKWCKEAVHRPATRTQKRPLAHQLVTLHHLMRERYMEEDKALEQAVLRFVADSGGVQRREREVKPLLYQRNRRYIACPDFLPEGVEVAPPSKKLEGTYESSVMQNQPMLVRACSAKETLSMRNPNLKEQAERAYRRLQRNRRFLRYAHETVEDDLTKLPNVHINDSTS